MMQKEISPELKERAIAWIESVQEEIRLQNNAKTRKSIYGVATKGKFEGVQVAQLKAGDTIKLRLSNNSSSNRSRLWILDRIVPMGVNAQLFLKCPTTDYEVNVFLRLDHSVLRGGSC